MEASTNTEVKDKIEGREAVRAAGKTDKLTQEGVSAAVAWFMSDEEGFTKVVQINVGTEDDPHWIDWTIQPVDIDVLRRISSNSANQQRRRGGGGDEVQANLSIVVAGTMDPDLKEMALKRRVASPEDVLRMRFAQKPGLLTQISQEILSLSGYDDADLRDPTTTVGNS